MSNEVWVRWKDSTSSAGMVLVDTVSDLEDDAQIKDLRKAFVKQQVLDVTPAAVVVRETENGEMLKPSTMLTNYFMPPANSAAAPGPGKSEDTALFLTVPLQQQQQVPFKTNILGDGVLERVRFVGEIPNSRSSIELRMGLENRIEIQD